MDSSETSASLDRPGDLGTSPASIVKRWILELKLADKREEDWRKKAEKVWNRYRQKDAKKNSFNILWANTETLRPAVYNTNPKPDVRRRYKDADPIGKVVSEVLGRGLEYAIDTGNLDQVLRSCVLDMLLPGRAVAWVRYVPSLAQVGADETTHVEANETHDAGGEALEGDTEELEWEQVALEHVQWDDYRQGVGKTDNEVCWKARKHKLTRTALEEKFGEIGSKVPLDTADDEDVQREQDKTIADAFKTADVWEIWHKDDAEVLFIAPSYKEAPLLTLPDPLNLQGFFPTPKPLMAIEDSSSTVPVPLYELYREQAEELDRVSERVNTLVKGLKFRGIYDSTLSELSELMRGQDNDLIPAANVTALIERGGLEKAIWFMPIEQAAMVLKELYVQREQTKAVIYEITGISDILRGSTNASETATAQQIKSQWGSNRLKRMQSDVARFARDLIRIMAEIMGERFQPETLQTMTGIQLPTDEQKAMAIQQGQQLPLPTWSEVMQVLRDDKQRTFKVDVETDSTVAASIETDMAGLKDILAGITQLVQGLGPAVQIGALPVEALKEIILTVVRRSKMGNAVEDALDKIKQPEPQQADQGAAQAAAQAAQAEQMRAQIESQKMQMDAQKSQVQQQLDAQKLQVQAELEQYKAQQQAQIEANRLEFDRWKAQLEAEAKIAVAEIQAKTQIKSQSMSLNAESLTEVSETGEKAPASGLVSLIDAVNENMARMLEAQQMGNAELTARQEAMIQHLTKPKQVVRGPDGRVVGIQ